MSLYGAGSQPAVREHPSGLAVQQPVVDERPSGQTLDLLFVSTLRGLLSSNLLLMSARRWSGQTLNLLFVSTLRGLLSSNLLLMGARRWSGQTLDLLFVNTLRSLLSSHLRKPAICRCLFCKPDVLSELEPLLSPTG